MHNLKTSRSSKDGAFDRARGKLVGSEQFITKPFTREDLLDAIQHYTNATAAVTVGKRNFMEKWLLR